MARLGLDRLFAFVSHCHGALDRDGLHVEQVRHPNDARRAARLLGVPPTARSFDPDRSDFSQDNAFWLFIYHRAKEAGAERHLVGMIGARVENLAAGEFTSVLTQRMNRLYSTSKSPVIENGPTPPVFGEISGRVASISELFVASDFRGKDHINLRALLLLMFAYARTEWDFDWLYALIDEGHAAQRYLATYCFANTHPAALPWLNTPQGRAGSEIFGSLSRADLVYLVELVTRRPSLLQFT